MVTESIQGLGRDGVDGARTDQLVHIHRVGIGRILGAGGSPERALDRASDRIKSGKALTSENLKESVISQPGICNGSLAAQGLCLNRSDRIQKCIHFRVHAGDEEGGHGGDLTDFQPGIKTVLQPSQISFHDRMIAFQEEYQGYVDIDAGGNGETHGRNTFLCGGNLDHQVRTIHPLPELFGLGQCPGSIMRQCRADFKRNVAIRTFALTVHR